MNLKIQISALFVLLCLNAPLAWGYDQLVTKQIFEIADFKTINGKNIKKVIVGYETYGTFSANKCVILLCHGSVDNSHFAGKYSPTDKAPGVWDHIIGPGNIIDTDKYFVIASDSLTNFMPKSPNVITTGPASIDPDTGKPYGMKFPIVTIADFVNVQKALLESLGITKIHAVMGYSMGGMQAMEWAARYPDMVARVVTVVSQVEQNAYNIQMKEVPMSIIKVDPNWNNGDYYGKAEPVEGLVAAMKAFQLTVFGYNTIDKTFDRKWADPNKNPADSMENKFAVQEQFEKVIRAAVKNADANSYLYIAHALNLFQVGHNEDLAGSLAKITAKVLFISAKSDLLMFPEYSKRAYKQMKDLGKDVDIYELKGESGHAESSNIQQAKAKLIKILN